MKFYVDFMLGKLAKKLRLLGLDAEYLSYKETKKILPKLQEKNTYLLTRNHNLPKLSSIIILESETLLPQLKELSTYFNLKKLSSPFTRCMICNTVLLKVTKEEAKNNVPLYVYETEEDFSYCSQCNKFYWKGTHYKAMMEWLSSLHTQL